MSSLPLRRLIHLVRGIAEKCATISLSDVGSKSNSEFNERVDTWFLSNSLTAPIEEAASLCGQVGLQGAARQLLKLSSDVFEFGTDIIFHDVAVPATPEEIESFQRRFGSFPLPSGDDQWDENVQHDRRIVLIGAVCHLRDYAQELLSSIAVNAESEPRPEAKPSTRKVNYPQHWTAEEIAKWEAAKPGLEWRWKGTQLQIKHHIEQYKQEWERRIGTTFPGADLDSLMGLASLAGLKLEETKGMNAWDIVQAAIEALEERGDIASHVKEAKQQSTTEEPEDLYRLRLAAHACASALYEYIRYAIRLLEAGEDPEFKQFKGKVWNPPDRTPEELLADDLETPEFRLQAVLGGLHIFVNVLIDKHGEFQAAFEPLEDELAAVYPGLQKISGATGRSHCKALESFVFHIVRYTFDATQKYTPGSEIDPELTDKDAIPFTPTGWYPSLKKAFSAFPDIDVEDHVHEAIEQEIADAWRIRTKGPIPDTKKADVKKKSSGKMPDTADVRDLCYLLSKHRAAITAGTKHPIEIARELTREKRGNDRKAKSLMRQARRFGHLWRD